MARRTAQAQWEGTLKDGKGRFWAESGEVAGVFSFSTRFEDSEGSNPEELIGAALAGCFSMQFSADLERAGYAPDNVRTVATVTLEKGDDGFSITRIDLDAQGEVPGIDAAEFRQIAERSKDGCPVSRTLAVPIELRAQLVH